MAFRNDLDGSDDTRQRDDQESTEPTLATNPDLGEQYRTAANLEARIELHARFSTNRADLYRWLYEQMDLPSRARLLELGGGAGTFWVKNLDRLPPGWAITLTDASPGMVREAASRLKASRHAFTYATVPAAALPFPDGSFDAVLAHFMLYHVGDRQQTLGEIARVLRPSGVLYAATNGTRHMREAKTLAMRAGLMTPAMVAAGDAIGFNLEDGTDQLKAWFLDVGLRRYEYALVVTECEPLLAYILSSWNVQAELHRLGPAAAQRAVTTLRRLIDEQLAAQGRIHITKDSGVFIAHRA